MITEDTLDAAARLIEAAAPGEIEETVDRLSRESAFTCDELRDVIFLLVEDGVLTLVDEGNFVLA